MFTVPYPCRIPYHTHSRCGSKLIWPRPVRCSYRVYQTQPIFIPLHCSILTVSLPYPNRSPLQMWIQTGLPTAGSVFVILINTYRTLTVSAWQYPVYRVLINTTQMWIQTGLATAGSAFVVLSCLSAAYVIGNDINQLYSDVMGEIDQFKVGRHRLTRFTYWMECSTSSG